MEKRKTILIVISKNVMRRNILETDFWNVFKAHTQDCNIVLVGESGSKELYEKSFGDVNVTVYEIQKESVGLWHKIVLFLIRSGTNAHGVTLYRWRSYELGEAGLMITLFKAFICNTLGRIGLYKKFVRVLYSRLSLKWIDDIFDKEEPDVVFVPSLIDVNVDALFGVTAHKRKKKVIGMVRSWDNLAIHGLLPFVPNVFIFQNQYLKECAEKIQSVNLSKITTSIVGLPHYDNYRFPESFLKPREVFLKENNLDPNKKLILLGGFDFYWSEDTLPAMLDTAIEEGEIVQSTQVVFRPHPKTPFQMEDYKIDALKHTILNAPFLDKKTAFTDTDFFINLVYHCDVLINVASTLAIDGAVFDRPVICVNFDDPTKNLPKWKQVGRLFDCFTHYEALMETGSARVSTSFEQMLKDINMYLDTPSTDHENRMKAIEKFVAPFEGDSGKRLVTEVLKEIENV